MPDPLDTLILELDDWAAAHGPTATRHAYGPLPDQHAMVRGSGPTAIVIHGGFWRARWREPIMAAVSVALAELGFAAWSIEYRRLGAGGGYPQTLDDVAAACRAAASPPVLAIGHSAGGQLALWAAAEGLVPAAVSLAGVCDLAGGARAGLGDGAVLDLMGAGPDEAPARYAHADPLQRLPIDARLALVHGHRDEIVPIRQSRVFAAASRCELVELPGAGHFELIDPRAPAWDAVAVAVRRVV
jgi:acetyl esterase/lipase